MTVFEFPKDGASIDLQVWSVTSASRTEQGWQLSGDHSAVDVSFLTDLPADAISTLSVVRAAEHSVSAISHLAPGVRRSQCPSLTALDFLYLAEESLTADAFRFVRQLPRLRKLGLQDVQITDEELLALQTELPGVDVTR
jgi:hypothetical protein